MSFFEKVFFSSMLMVTFFTQAAEHYSDRDFDLEDDELKHFSDKKLDSNRVPIYYFKDSGIASAIGSSPRKIFLATKAHSSSAPEVRAARSSGVSSVRPSSMPHFALGSGRSSVSAASTSSSRSSSRTTPKGSLLSAEKRSSSVKTTPEKLMKKFEETKQKCLQSTDYKSFLDDFRRCYKLLYRGLETYPLNFTVDLLLEYKPKILQSIKELTQKEHELLIRAYPKTIL